MYGILYDLIVQEEYIKAGILFISIVGILLLVMNIGIKIANRIVLFFEAKKSLEDFIKKHS